MIKFRWYYDNDKEEKFLNEMSKKGFAMTKMFLGVYTFKKSKINEYTYRVDIINDKSGQELAEYLELVSDTGAEFIQKWGAWIYFRKKGTFELYTDIQSKIEQYTKIRNTFGILSIAEFCFIPSAWNSYFNTDLTVFLISGLIISAVAFIFLVQTIKCNIKINKLKKLKNN